MKASALDYAQSLYELLKRQPEKSHQFAERFLLILRRHKNSHLLPLIMSRIEEIEANENKILIAAITSAKGLSTSDRKAISEKLLKQHPAYQSVSLREIIDESVIGGVRLRLGEQVIDHTVNTKLMMLSSRLE